MTVNERTIPCYFCDMEITYFDNVKGKNTGKLKLAAHLADYHKLKYTMIREYLDNYDNDMNFILAYNQLDI